MVKNNDKNSFDFNIYPGEIIKDLLEDRNMKQEELCNRIGYSLEYINEVIDGKKNISPEFAESIGKYFEINPNFFMNLQQMYDENIK